MVTVGQLFPYVMYGGVVMNEYLLNLSKIVYESYKDVPDISISKYYKPLSWLPHITLGKTLDKKQMVNAFSVMQESFAPFTAKVTKIGLAKVNPHEDVAVFELKESPLLIKGKYVGVDGCKGGWIAAIYDKGSLKINKYSCIDELVDANNDYNELLIDMVIGLQSSKDEVRPDSVARALIPGRTSTIIYITRDGHVNFSRFSTDIFQNNEELGKTRKQMIESYMILGGIPHYLCLYQEQKI